MRLGEFDIGWCNFCSGDLVFKRIKLFLLGVTAIVLLSPSALALPQGDSDSQPTPGTEWLKGEVIDPSGSPLSNVLVEVTP